MKKIAIMTDSNSGITQSEAKTLGVTVLPMPFMINDETFFEDISLSQEEFYKKLESGANISTSQPSPESVMEIWDQLLNEYDEIVHIPMSSGLSGSYQTAAMLSREDAYENKVFVVNNQRISVIQRQSVLDALDLVQKGKNASEIHTILEEDKANASVYIMLDTLYYLKKGGRITPAAAALGTLLKIKPVLQIQGEKLDAFAKARTTSQGKSIMFTAAQNDISNRFGGKQEPPKVKLHVAHSNNEEAAKAMIKELEKEFPNHEIQMDPLSLSIACHIGPGSLAVAVSKKIELN